jgi:flagellar biosynthesis protein FlhF
MQIHRVRGRDLADALSRARRLHGESALVLTHERMPDGATTVAVGLANADLPRKPAPASLPDVERVLRRTGCSDELIASTIERVSLSGARGAYAFDAAARMLGQSVAIAPSPKLSKNVARPLVLAFVGAAGVGKTTTLAKLAVRLTRAGRRVGLVTLDARRPGASALLASIAAPLQASLDIAASARDLAALVDRSRSRDVVLVDTSGAPAGDVLALRELASVFAAERRADALTTYLVLAATAGRTAMGEMARAFADVRPLGVVITKLDETRAPATALEFSTRAELPLAFLCDGRELGAHLHRPEEGRIADLFLRGRLA